MKRIWYVGLAPLLLSGCSSLMWGDSVAPVNEAGVGKKAEVAATPEGKIDGELDGSVTTYGLETGSGGDMVAYRAPEPSATQPQASAPVSRSSGAVASLIGEADAQQAAGDYAAAAATLERGLRIAPRDPDLWNRLASVRLIQGRYNEAGSMAARSNSLAGGNVGLKRHNWQLIAEARTQNGDAQGAAEARRMIQTLGR